MDIVENYTDNQKLLNNTRYFNDNNVKPNWVNKDDLLSERLKAKQNILEHELSKCNLCDTFKQYLELKQEYNEKRAEAKPKDFVMITDKIVDELDKYIQEIDNKNKVIEIYKCITDTINERLKNIDYYKHIVKREIPYFSLPLAKQGGEEKGAN